MSQVIRIPENLYKRLESLAKGFDTPAGVVERILDFYEKYGKTEVLDKDNLEDISPDSSSHDVAVTTRFNRKAYSSIATGSFTRDIENDLYTITSPNGISESFRLPDVNDKEAIQKLTHRVENFVKEQGGTIGQIKSARKKLTEFGYHITK